MRLLGVSWGDRPGSRTFFNWGHWILILCSLPNSGRGVVAGTRGPQALSHNLLHFRVEF